MTHIRVGEQQDDAGERTQSRRDLGPQLFVIRSLLAWRKSLHLSANDINNVPPAGLL